MKNSLVKTQWILLSLLLAGCAGGRQVEPSTSIPVETEVTTSLSNPSPAPQTSPTACTLAPLVVPMMPTEIPGYLEVDPATGLHMTGKPQEVDIASYRLVVNGSVDRPLKLSYDELRCLPRVEKHLILTCPGFFQDEATWAGVPLGYLLDLAGVQPGSLHVKLYSSDGYYVSIPMENARGGESFLAYELEGKTLPRLQGFPLRAVFPGMAGSNWVKWLVQIEVY